MVREPCPFQSPPRLCQPLPRAHARASWVKAGYSRAWEMPHQAGHSGRDRSHVGRESESPREDQRPQTLLSSTSRLSGVARAGPYTIWSLSSFIGKIES